MWEFDSSGFQDGGGDAGNKLPPVEADAKKGADVAWCVPMFNEHLNLQSALSIVKIYETRSAAF